MAVAGQSRTRSRGIPFLERRDVLAAISRLAVQERLTLVVGAGASVEAGLPTWGALITELLAAAGMQEAGSDHTELARWTVDREGIIGAASIAEAALGDAFIPTVRKALYGRSGARPVPGPTARAVAQIQKSWQTNCRVFTTNYDRVLEDAIWEAQPQFDVSSDFGGCAPEPGEILVHHLHGLLTPTGDHDVVLAEAGYYLTPAESWQQQKLIEHLRETTCIFVGASLSDQDIIRWVYRSNTGKQHIVLLPRQADLLRGGSAVSRSTRDAVEKASFQRWQKTGLTVLTPDYFVQNAQFLNEVVLRKRQREAYAPYKDRLDRWEREISQDLLSEKPLTLFNAIQDTLQGQLRRWLNVVAKELGDVLPSSERLGLHLWVRQPEKRSLLMFASSDRVWRDPRTLESVPIGMPSPLVAVQGFCTGSAVVDSTVDNPTSRWNSVQAIPVFLEQPPWHRLPVGVITLATTLPIDKSALSRVNPDVLGYIRKYLAGNAAAVLTP